MNILGQITATSNTDIVMQAAQAGFKLVYVGDIMEMPKEMKFINAVAFTPDYQSMCAVIEGNDEAFARLYYQNLSAPVAEELFAIIMAALCKGVNILLYFPQDTLQLKYPYLLMKYMQERYGLIAGDKNSPFQYNNAFDQINTRLLYVYKLIDWKTYILSVDDADPVVLIRLREDLCPIYNIPITISDIDMISTVTRIKEEILSAMNKKKLFSTVEGGK